MKLNFGFSILDFRFQTPESADRKSSIENRK